MKRQRRFGEKTNSAGCLIGKNRPLPRTRFCTPRDTPPAGVPIPPSSAHHPLTSTRRPAPGLVFNPRRGASVTFDSRKNRRCSADEVLLSQVLLSIRPVSKTDRSFSAWRCWFQGAWTRGVGLVIVSVKEAFAILIVLVSGFLGMLDGKLLLRTRLIRC